MIGMPSTRTAIRIAATAGTAAALFGMTACTAKSTTTTAAAVTTTHATTAPIATTAAPAATTAPALITPNAKQYVAAAWLSAKQLPFGGTIAWQMNVDAAGSPLGAAIFQETGDLEGDTATCTGSSFSNGLIGTQQESATGPSNNVMVDDVPDTIAAATDQNLYFYKTSADVDAAWNTIATGFGSCGVKESGIDASTGEDIAGSTTQTVNTPDSECWTNLFLKPSVLSDSTVDHICFTRQGTLIEAVSVSVNAVTSFSTIDFSAMDFGTLQLMQQSLSVYSK